MRPILGKTALLGITSYDRQGTLIRQEQFVGKVEWADDQHGIVIRCDNGDTKTVPPDFRAVLYAPRGTYRHQATGEVVTTRITCCRGGHGPRRMPTRRRNGSPIMRHSFNTDRRETGSLNIASTNSTSKN